MTVVIIGAGAAGSTAAYRLRQFLGSAVRIVVLERGSRAGGRVGDMAFAGTRVEIGGTLIHSSNRRLTDLVDATGLERTLPGAGTEKADRTLGIWTGHSFVVRTRTSAAALGWSLVRRYGVGSLVRLRREVVDVKERWTRVYERQDADVLYETPRELINAIGLTEHTSVTLAGRLGRAGVRPRMITEVADGITRTMYNQSSRLNALAGGVALIGGGFAGGSLFSISGGNALLFERTLDLAAAELVLDRSAVAIRPGSSDHSYEVTDDWGGSYEANAVVIAAPLETAELELGQLGVDLPSRPYQTVHSTLVVGSPSNRYFGLTDGAVPTNVLTTASPDLPFKSLAVTGWSPLHQSPIYKIYSADKIDDPLLQMIFQRVHDAHRLAWRAYPVLDPAVDWPPFRLHDRLFYVNAFESAVSTMETEAVAAWNVAGLAARDLVG